MGPVEYLIIGFPGNRFKGEIVPAITELINNGIIRILDLVFIKKDENGNIKTIEMSELDDEEGLAFDYLEHEINDLLNKEDITLAAQKLEPNTSALMLVFENAWATRLRDAIVNANGKLLENARIPAAVVQAAFEAVGKPIA
jgi:hypothetical protein